MAGDFQRMRQQAGDALGERYAQSRARYMATMQKSIDRRDRRRAEREAAERQAALEQQRIDAQARRDKQQQEYAQANAAQRASYAADAQYADYRNTSNLQKQEQKGILKRDEKLSEYEQEQRRRQALDVQGRDARQFDYQTRENDQKFGQNLYRDELQQGYTLDRDRMQHGNTLERDAVQFGFDTQRTKQQQRNTLERDYFQSGIQAERDQRLNQFDTERDYRQNEFATEADQRQQGYTQQNMYQREAADISAKWQDQVSQARNAGLDFSERQRKEINDLDATFRKNVLNGPYDEGLKQRAMVEHQKKLASIIPEERVSNPDDEIAQTFKYNEQMGTWLKRSRDSKGFPDWEPLGSGGQDPMMQAAQKQAEMQQKQAQQQRQEMLKAEKERLASFKSVVESIAQESDPESGVLTYAKRDADGKVIPGVVDRAAVMKEAMDRFADEEKFWRESYELPPLPQYQAEADKIRSEQSRQQDLQTIEQIRQQNKTSGTRVNPYRPQTQGVTAPAGGVNRPAANVPVISSISPLPKEVVTKLSTMPGGDKLAKLRKKHETNKPEDRTVKMAIDIVIKSMMTGDTSDPDFAEAQDILARAGFKAGP